jgi:D-alanyl-D-alanine carboxypeptidase/D-alanyl-D-alanine-endopeptidase (penicillin-binding protein 4)
MNYEFRIVNNNGKSRANWLRLLTLNSALLTLISCSVQKQITQSVKENVLATPALQTAHIGISIYEPATNKYWFDYQGDHYFVPASNTKLPTCYAAMKHLGDSLVGIRYEYFDDTAITIHPTGDPTFLHADFKKQPVLDFLQKEKKSFYLFNGNWEDESLGSGWAWNDYNSDYMAERSAFPLNGNLIRIKLKSSSYELLESRRRRLRLSWEITPAYFKDFVGDIFILPLKLAARRDIQDSSIEKAELQKFYIQRQIGNNQLSLFYGSSKFSTDDIPYYTNNDSTATAILRQDYSINIQPGVVVKHDNSLLAIHSQPTDSLLKPMMHRSDNFFAEQSLLMVSNELLGVMNDSKIIDTLLKTDFKDLPQKPRWADGSGLSRYNLFSPRDFVTILNKMKNEFGMDRIKTILPTGGEGTISSYYKTEAGYIFGKTGTLSGVVAFSGFLYTKKGKLLIFSTLVNNHTGSATDIRKAIEKFLQEIRNKY